MLKQIFKAQAERAKAIEEMDPDTVWVTRDGVRIPVSEMSDNHLLNTIKYFYDRREGLVDMLSLSMLMYSIDAPDGASYCAEQGAHALMDDDPDSVWISCMSNPEVMWNIIKEAKAREIYKQGLAQEVKDSIKANKRHGRL